MARRAASIWRAVTRSGSIALSPYWPKLSSVPALAAPWMRPLWALRNFVRIGCSMARTTSLHRPRSRRVAPRAPGLAFGEPLVLRHRVVLHDFALEDPDLDAARAVGRERGRDPIVDVGAQRVQRHATLAIPLHARDFRTAEPAGAIDADTLGTESHRRLHGPLHRPAECHAALELLRDRFGDELSVELGLADLDDVDDDIGVGEFRDLSAKLVDVGAFLADDHSGTGRMDRHPAFLVRSLDHDLRYRGLLELLHQSFADLHVFVQEQPVTALAGEPTRVPRPVYPEPEPDRIDLLTHDLLPPTPRPRPDAPR